MLYPKTASLIELCGCVFVQLAFRSHTKILAKYPAAHQPLRD